jgi:hypothetical protein
MFSKHKLSYWINNRSKVFSYCDNTNANYRLISSIEGFKSVQRDIHLKFKLFRRLGTPPYRKWVR